MSGMTNRVRGVVLQALCSLDAGGEDKPSLAEQFIEQSDASNTIKRSAAARLREILVKRDECDFVLANHSRKWKLERLAIVDRNILRLAAFELLKKKTKTAIVLSEANKLAERFSTKESPRFISGVLNSIAKEISPPAAG